MAIQTRLVESASTRFRRVMTHDSTRFGGVVTDLASYSGLGARKPALGVRDPLDPPKGPVSCYNYFKLEHNYFKIPIDIQSRQWALENYD